MSCSGKVTFASAVVSSVLMGLILGPIQQIRGFSTGAPTTSCADMIPQHGVDAQFGPSPFLIDLMDGVNKQTKKNVDSMNLLACRKSF
jgi:hypothetical protein